jgi:hypothetical protein
MAGWLPYVQWHKPKMLGGGDIERVGESNIGDILDADLMKVLAG